MNYFKKTLIFIFVSSTFYAQESNYSKFNLGIMTEITSVISKREFTSTNEVNFSTNIYPVSLFLSGRINFSESLNFEFRPGFIFGGEYYTGLEYGVYLRYLFNNSKLYLIGGLNFHDNFGEGHNLVTVTDDTIILANISFGYHLSESLGILISYYYPINTHKIYSGANEVLSDGNYKIFFYDDYLVSIFRLGLDYTF